MDIDWDKEPDIAELERATNMLAAKPEEAVSRLERLADRGSLMSMLHLGIIFERGDNVPCDQDKSEHWYRSALNGGLLRATYYLGLLYKRNRRYVEAFKVLQLGASKGYAPTLTALGSMYFEGKGVGQDIQKARELWEEGVSEGQVRSKKALGQKFVSGAYGLRNIPKGLALIISSHAEAVSVARKDLFSHKLL